MKSLFCFIFIAVAVTLNAQQKIYTTANAHSHNDYEQARPFQLAYQEKFGSIEADIHLVNGKIYVAHDNNEIYENRTLSALYLEPIEAHLAKIDQLQLLIDVKTEAKVTLDALVSTLSSFPSIISSKKVKIVVSGNRPPADEWKNYPEYILFDGRMGISYSNEQLKKIGLISDSYQQFITGNNYWPLKDGDREKIKKAIKAAHEMDKPARLWAQPDFPEAWQTMMDLGLDYINTDKISELSDFLLSSNKQLRLLPYNRIIESAGHVVRYGKPDLENHALDITAIPGTPFVAVMERYGLFIIDPDKKDVVDHFRFTEAPRFSKYLSTYSGIKSFIHNNKTYIVWSAAERDGKNAGLICVQWANGITNPTIIAIPNQPPAPNAIPNDIAIQKTPEKLYLHVALNGNNSIVKIDWETQRIILTQPTGVAPYGIAIAGNKVFVTNWAGEKATDSTRERAGVPWGLAYTDPRTGATASGSVSVYHESDGKFIREIPVGLHPNAIIASGNGEYIYVANGSSDEVSVINAHSMKVVEQIKVGLLKDKEAFQGSTPNGLTLNQNGDVLYVANGMDNAVAVIQLSKKSGGTLKSPSAVKGLIPTEAYPAGLIINKNRLIVANLESDGANVVDSKKQARSIHHELASVSIIDIPEEESLQRYTAQVLQHNLVNRIDLLSLPPRKDVLPVPVPERLGEPSVFKHVVYIIKENKTYDQVLGDIKSGNGDSTLCVFGEFVTPNTHALAKQFGWMDNYHASGKSSAEGHQWTDAGMVSDYVEKNVRAWFRSYPHRQADAMVYNKNGFIWNHALDHGKTVRVFGEACETAYDKSLKWKELFERYKQGMQPNWHNETTIARLKPIISEKFPDCDNMVFSDQQRADVFIDEWKQFEKNNHLPNLMVLSLPNDHTAGTSPDFPSPDAMVADNDLALGRIIEMITKSKYWDSTVIFITQDDSQSGWDHVSAYRTVGLVVSPFSSGKLISTHFNQVSMLRTIEQILGIPPMNAIDATSRLMSECFISKKQNFHFTHLPSNIPLDKMNKPMHALSGKAKRFAEISQKEIFTEVDGGEDDRMNKVIWYYTKGDQPYPSKK